MGATRIGWHKLDNHGGGVIEYTGYLAFRDEFLGILDPALYTDDWLDGMVWAGFFRCISNDQAALLYEIKQYPTGLKELHFVAAAGDLTAIIEELRPKAEEYAKSMNCSLVSVQSRPGWVRALKPHDYEQHQIILRKEI